MLMNQRVVDKDNPGSKEIQGAELAMANRRFLLRSGQTRCWRADREHLAEHSPARRLRDSDGTRPEAAREDRRNAAKALVHSARPAKRKAVAPERAPLVAALVSL